MNEQILRYAAELMEYVESQDAPTEPLVGTLLALGCRDFQDLLARFDFASQVSVTRQLVDRAHRLLSRMPKDAVSVSTLAVRLAGSVVAAIDDERETVLELGSDALREQAHALLIVGDFENAKKVADDAIVMYSLVLNAGLTDGELLWNVLLEYVCLQIEGGEVTQHQTEVLQKATSFGLILGQIYHGLGETDRGLTLIEQSSNMLLSLFQQSKKYVDGRLIYAAVLLKAGRYSDALAAFENTAAVAKDLNDSETLAHILQNVGWCYYRLGKLKDAETCVTTAMKLFEELGLNAHALRSRNVLAILLMDAGRYRSAVSELYISRARYLAAGLPNDAARVMLRIVRALIMDGRAATINWEETIRTFSAASGIRSDAMHAITFLREVASARPLRIDDIQDAERIIERLDDNLAEASEAG